MSCIQVSTPTVGHESRALQAAFWGILAVVCVPTEKGSQMGPKWVKMTFSKSALCPFIPFCFPALAPLYSYSPQPPPPRPPPLPLMPSSLTGANLEQGVLVCLMAPAHNTPTTCRSSAGSHSSVLWRTLPLHLRPIPVPMFVLVCATCWIVFMLIKISPTPTFQAHGSVSDQVFAIG